MEAINMAIGATCVAWSVLAFGDLVGANAMEQREDAPADAVQAVRVVLDRQVADWNKGDLDGFLAGYWNSPKVVFQSAGERTYGFEAMRERYRRRYKAEGKEMGRLDFSALEIESLGPEVALARGRWQLVLSNGTKPAGLFTVILRRLPDGWKIVHDHTSADEAAPPQPAKKADVG
jgi:beta-aspartyl-peptidase (threonine type)